MKFYKKLAERAVKTFLQVFVAVFVAGAANLQVFKDASAVQTLVISAVAAGLSAVSSLLSKKVGPPDTPSIV